MSPYKLLALLCTLCLCLGGCPEDDEPAANGGDGGVAAAPGTNNCKQVASENARLGTELGCTADPNIGPGCNMLYAKKLCIPEWEALIGCLDFVAEDFICDPNHNNHLEPTSCATEKNAFDACVAK